MLRKIEGMARAGMTQEEILSSTTLQQMAATQLEKGGTELADDLKANPPANPFAPVEGVDSRSQAAMPRRGVTRGVRWEHGERSITLEFEIDDDVRAKQIACELGEGFLCVQVPANAQGGSTLSLTVALAAPSKVAASKSPISFAGCGT